jgi:hypothetical protein
MSSATSSCECTSWHRSSVNFSTVIELNKFGVAATHPATALCTHYSNTCSILDLTVAPRQIEDAAVTRRKDPARRNRRGWEVFADQRPHLDIVALLLSA